MERISIRETNLSFVFFMLGYVGLSLALGEVLPENAPEWLFYCVNYLVIIAPIAIVLICKRLAPGAFLRLERIGILDVVIAYVGAYTLLPVVSFLNVVTMLFSKNHVNGMLMEVYDYPLWLQIVLISVMPALCEEFVFRGFFYGSYRKRNIVGAALMSGLLFGVLHMNINQFAYAFVIGVAFCLVYEASGNFFIPVIMHFAINANTIFTLAVSGESSQEFATSAQVPITEMMPDSVLYAFVGMLFVAGVLCAYIFMVFVVGYFAKRNGRKGFIMESIGRYNEEAGGRFIDISILLSVGTLIIYMIALEMYVNVR